MLQFCKSACLFCVFFSQEDLKPNEPGSRNTICENMSPESLSLLVEPMKNSISCHPRIHSVWTALIDFIASQTSMPSPVLRIWLEIVDKFLLTSTHMRKYLALNLLPQIVTHVDEGMSFFFPEPDVRVGIHLILDFLDFPCVQRRCRAFSHPT